MIQWAAYLKNDMFVKILSIFSFSFIILILITISVIPLAENYEVSIYGAYPFQLWIFFVGSIGCGISILIFQAFYGEINSKWWLTGFLSIMIINFIFLMLPVFRGYAIYGREDTLTHIGFIKDILSTGNIGGENIYPIIHILTGSISNITGLYPSLLVNIIPQLFSIFFITSLYLFSLILTKNQGQSLLITVLSSLLIFGGSNLSFAPSFQSFCFIPIILFLIFKTRTLIDRVFHYKLLLIILLFLIPFFHPMTSLYLILLLLCLDILILIWKKFNNTNVSNKIYIHKTSLIPTLLIFVTFFTWLSSFTFFSYSIRRISDWLFSDTTGLTQSIFYAGLFQRANITFFEFIELFLKIHGSIVIYFILSFLLCITIFLKQFFLHKRTGINQFIFSFLFIIFCLLVFIFFTGDFIIGYGRALKYPIFVSLILNGICIYIYVNTRKSNSSIKNQLLKKNILLVILIFILLSSYSISIFNTFESPTINRYNHQVTYTEIEGAKWFLFYRNENHQIDDIKVVPFRFADAILGKKEEKTNIRGTGIWSYPPDHFNYTHNNILGTSYDEERYLLINDLSRLLYPKVYPKYSSLWRFSDEDFFRLYSDKSVNQIYINDGFEIRLIHNISDIVK